MISQSTTTRVRSQATCQNRNGLSLLEVILSITILGLSLVAIGALVSTGYRSALDARLQSDANLLCETKMAEVVAGVIELQSVSGAVIEENREWEYRVDVEPSDQLGLLFVRVTVSQLKSVSDRPIELSLVRFVPDPDYEPELEEDFDG